MWHLLNLLHQNIDEDYFFFAFNSSLKSERGFIVFTKFMTAEHKGLFTVRKEQLGTSDGDGC